MMRQFFAHGLTAFWPLLAMAIFMTVFVVVVVRTMRRQRNEIDHLSRMPLDDGEGARHV